MKLIIGDNLAINRIDPTRRSNNGIWMAASSEILHFIVSIFSVRLFNIVFIIAGTHPDVDSQIFIASECRRLFINNMIPSINWWIFILLLCKNNVRSMEYTIIRKNRTVNKHIGIFIDSAMRLKKIFTDGYTKMAIKNFKWNFRKTWRRESESNRWIKVLQTSALPLGYRAILIDVQRKQI